MKFKLLALIGTMLPWIAGTAGAQTIYIADQYTNAVYDQTPGGSPAVFSSGGLLNGPGYLRFDTIGNLFVANNGPPGGNPNGTTVIKITPAGVQSTFASGLNGAYGLAFDTGGNLWIGGFGSNKVIEYNPAGAVLTTISTGLNKPCGMAFNSAGNLFVANYGGKSVSEYSSTGILITSSFVSGLKNPEDVAFDSIGNLFVADTGADAIYEYTSTGTLIRTVVSSVNAVDTLAFDGAGDLIFGTAPGVTGGSLYEITAASLATGSPTYTLIGSGLPYDGVTFNGTAVPVPEPGGPLVLGAAGVLALLGRRRKRASSLNK